MTTFEVKQGEHLRTFQSVSSKFADINEAANAAVRYAYSLSSATCYDYNARVQQVVEGVRVSLDGDDREDPRIFISLRRAKNKR